MSEAQPVEHRAQVGALAEAIGARVRGWRTERSWTLDVLADRSGVSRRTLIGIEQGQSNPSVGALLRLSAALGVALAALVEEERPAGLQVTRAGSAPCLWQGSAGGRGLLVGATEPPNVAELWDWVMQPGEQHSSEAHTPGTREVLLVLEGELEVTVAAQSSRLQVGDSAVLAGDQSHGYACAGEAPTRFSMAVLQPGVRG
ncbi:helix-turn-helix domain-containing protein [Streptomyces sp. NP160]|uniref:helix-turn-helix domain-containing protein n=1 Tax=Streptomyces sp. NP160 TaxID=2586637 RepID=UPI001118F4BF|nr:XRE family transcriptional regulator [Streptomyces sp. NP160]TNM61944.1 helix-turn-helix domain-containing protein [Streptomyces sp. NP160]